jgi:molecular chaperone DnaK
MVKRALVIANSQYDDGFFTALPAAEADAAALAGVLADPAVGEFTVEQMVNVGQRAAMRAIHAFFADAQRDDLLVLHLSLHGWKDLRNRLYFVARDTERDVLEATAISADFVSERMSWSKSGRIVLLLDCCYSGAFAAGMLRRSGEAPQVNVAEPFAGKGRIVVTASTSLQFAHEGQPDVRLSRDQAQPSLFTAAVVQGLRDGSADLDRDGLISVNELYDYVYDQVRRKIPGQTPTLSVDSVQGTIYLARNPASLDSDTLAELRDAVADQQAWKRVGALHLIERLLGSVRAPVRDAAHNALFGLIADDDPEVSQRARQLWHGRGLGDIPASDLNRRTRKPRMADTEFVAGIDFGTTNSAIGVFENDDVRMIPNAEGALSTPSVVALTEDGQPIVGTAAKRQAIRNSEYTVASVKLRLGTDWSIERGGARYSAEEIAALILARLRADAEAYTGGELYGVVLTCPAYFSYAQRYALRQAAKIAGINVYRILNEPTAASITYGLNRTGDETVLVVDLGGGTFDVSLLIIGEGICEVRATAGDNHLGGNDWDRQLADHLVRLAREQYGAEVSRDGEAMQRLLEAAETAKIELSSASSTRIWLPYLAVTPIGPVHLDTTVTRAEFEALTSDTLDRCKAPINRAIEDAWGIKLQDISHVILVGGATRMPAVGELVRQMTGGRHPYRGLIPEGIVTGAALQAGILKGKIKDVLLLDVMPLSLGIEVPNGIYVKLIERNTTIPTKRSEIFTTSRDNQETVTVHVLEGEKLLIQYNSSLAVIELPGIAPAPKGVPQIEITFDIDANGVLGVSARDLGTGRKQAIAVNRESVAMAEQNRRSKHWPELLKNVPIQLPSAEAPTDLPVTKT